MSTRKERYEAIFRENGEYDRAQEFVRLRAENEALRIKLIDAENDRDRFIEGAVLQECRAQAAEAECERLTKEVAVAWEARHAWFAATGEANKRTHAAEARADKAAEDMLSVRRQIDAEHAKLSGDDGYNYAAGQEYGLRQALIIIDAAINGGDGK